MSEEKLTRAEASLKIENQIAQQIIDALNRGLSAFSDAGKLLVDAIAEYPNIKERIMELEPRIDPQALADLERIGRKQLHPMLMASNRPALKALRKMPYSEQERYATQPVELLVVANPDNTTTLQVSIHSMTADQVRQAFNGNHVRSLAEQRAYIESEKSKRMIKQAPPITSDYVVSRGCIVTNRPMTLTQEDLVRMLAEVTHRAK